MKKKIIFIDQIQFLHHFQFIHVRSLLSADLHILGTVIWILKQDK